MDFTTTSKGKITNRTEYPMPPIALESDSLLRYCSLVTNHFKEQKRTKTTSNEYW
jgi:hypothetical protein